jgi:DNA topoisomerase IB
MAELDRRVANRYSRAIIGARFTAKDFPTWGGSVVAAEVL